MKLELSNCLWLLLPVLVWNATFIQRLPQPGFGSDIGVPRVVLTMEHILRGPVLVLPLFLPLRWGHAQAQTGVILYVTGLLLYFAAWIPLLIYPAATWIRSGIGLLAPAYTPLIWLVGIALMGRSWPYALISLFFVIIHTYHNVLAHGL